MNGKDKNWFKDYLDSEFAGIRQQISSNHGKLITLYEDTIKPQVDKNTKYIEKDKKFKYGLVGVLTFIITGGGLLAGFWNKIVK